MFLLASLPRKSASHVKYGALVSLAGLLDCYLVLKSNHYVAIPGVAAGGCVPKMQSLQTVPLVSL